MHTKEAFMGIITPKVLAGAFLLGVSFWAQIQVRADPQPAPSLESPLKFEARLSLLAKAIADACPAE
jgi:hypothetical protein